MSNQFLPEVFTCLIYVLLQCIKDANIFLHSFNLLFPSILRKLNFPIPFNLHFSIPFKFPSLKPSFIPTLQFPFPSAFNSLINFNFPSLQPSFLPTLNFPSLQPTILPTLQFPFPSTFISPNTSISLPINLHFSQHFNFTSPSTFNSLKNFN